VEPISLYLEKLRLHRADKDKTAPVTRVLEKHQQDIWAISNQPGRRPIQPLPTSSHAIKMDAVEKANRFATEQRRERQTQSRARESQSHQVRSPIEAWLRHKWHLQWDKYRENKNSPVYQSALDAKPLPKDLHTGLSRAKSSILTQLRTEAIGLNDFLAARNVPNVTPACSCGWVRQTPKHIVVHCPLLGGREQMWTRAGTLDYNTALQTKRGTKAITSWLLSWCNQLRLPQFCVARDLADKQQDSRHPLTPWW
jgi:hypothetical protein